MELNLLYNELDGDSEVRTERRAGRGYLVAPTTLVKSMELDNGYVPQKELRKSAKAWNGTSVNLNHPADARGNLTTANTPEMAQKTRIGTLYNVEAANRGESLRGEVWIDTAKADAIGGDAETVVESLDAGESVSVSTAYFGDPLDAGTYDGQHRQQVIGNLRPDHLAVLPNKEGRCSVEDGCYVGEPPASTATPTTPGGASSVATAANATTTEQTIMTNESGYDISKLNVHEKALRQSITNSDGWSARDTNRLLLMNDAELVEAAVDAGVDVGNHVTVIGTDQTLAENAQGGCGCGGHGSVAINTDGDEDGDSGHSRNADADASEYPSLSLNARQAELAGDSDDTDTASWNGGDGTGAFHGGGERNAGISGGSSDADEYPSLSYNDRLAEAEGGE